jgi:hypothetical protein
VVNGLVEIDEHRVRQAEINDLWEQLQKPLRRIKNRIDGMPTLPVTEHIM